MTELESNQDARRFVAGATAAVNAYAAFLVGACHALGSPLGALLSNVALVREDLEELRKVLSEGGQPDTAAALVERVHGDLGDALKLIDRLRATLVEVRSLENDAPGEKGTAFLPILEVALRHATSSAFRGARVTSQVIRDGGDDEYFVKSAQPVVLRLILGLFATAASPQRARAERSVFQIQVTSNERCVIVRIVGDAVGGEPDETLRMIFAGLFDQEGGRLSVSREAGSLMVSGEFAR